MLRRGVDLFAWAPVDMLVIDAKVVCHRLSIYSTMKPMTQRRRKVGKEKPIPIRGEIEKLKNADFITKVKYSNWLANIFLVQKSSNKWRMCVNFIDLKQERPCTYT